MRLPRELLRLLCVFGVCGNLSAEPFDRAAAIKWADHYAAEYSIPAELVHAIIAAESAWQPRAVSPKGAAGLMQLMPATAATFGVTNRFDAEQNIRGGVAYLAHLLKLFRGDLRLVSAAYVAGENRILRVGLSYSNSEVFEYVSRVAHLYRQERIKSLEKRGGKQ